MAAMPLFDSPPEPTNRRLEKQLFSKGSAPLRAKHGVRLPCTSRAKGKNAGIGALDHGVHQIRGTSAIDFMLSSFLGSCGSK